MALRFVREGAGFAIGGGYLLFEDGGGGGVGLVVGLAFVALFGVVVGVVYADG